MDNSTIGGVSEVDNAVYRTDVVQNFVEEDQDDEIVQILSKQRPSSGQPKFDFGGASGSRSVAVRLENNFASIDEGSFVPDQKDEVKLFQ